MSASSSPSWSVGRRAGGALLEVGVVDPRPAGGRLAALDLEPDVESQPAAVRRKHARPGEARAHAHPAAGRHHAGELAAIDSRVDRGGPAREDDQLREQVRNQREQQVPIRDRALPGRLARGAFGPYLSLLGRDKIYEPAAVSIISFGLTWLAMIFLALVARGSRTRVQIGGAR